MWIAGSGPDDRPVKPKGARPYSKYPCIFLDPFVIKNVDPRVKEAFEDKGKKAPFGDLRRTWRQQHCATLNPYGSEDCHGTIAECSLWFLRAAQQAADGENPAGLFRYIAKRHALERADSKPLPRDRLGGPKTPGDVPGSGPGVDARQHPASFGGVDTEAGIDTLRRPLSRPVSIGSLLGSIDARPRQGSANDGEEGPR